MSSRSSRSSGMLRLLHQGLETSDDRHPASRRIADCFPLEQLASAGLWPESVPFPCFDRERLFTPTPCRMADWPTTSEADEETVSPPLYLCGESSSSLDVAHELIRRDELPVWGSVLVASQRSGRGQLGRNWISPQGNIYAALRLPATPPFTTTAAAPAFGGLVAEALSALGFCVSMKWPNDILQHDSHGTWRKVGGLLIEERRIPKETGTALVAGIGFNLASMPPDALMRADRAIAAGRLTHQTGESPGVVCLWRRLVCQLFFCYAKKIDMQDAQAWKTVAERHLAFTGQTVLISDGPGNQDRHTGILEGLDDSGGLRLRGWKEGFLSGSLSIPGS